MQKSKFKYYIINKPFGCLSQFTGEEGDVTLKSIYNFPKDVYPVGRLDKDSEGLLLLTNDKRLNETLLHPKNEHPRTYWVQVDNVITEEALQQLEKGVTIKIKGKEYQTKPAKASVFANGDNLPPRNPPIRFRKNIPTSWIELTLTEGKNRQVRKMTAAVGFPTLRLIRSAIGNFKLDHLGTDQVIEIDGSAVQKEVLGV